MINMNDSLNFMNPLKVIKSFLNTSILPIDIGGALSGGLSGFASGGGIGAALGALSGGLSSREAGGQLAGGYAMSAEEQKRAREASLAEYGTQYEMGRAGLDPYAQAGTQALGQYQGMLAGYQPTELPTFQGQYQDPGAFTGQVDLEADPGYQFRKEQGLSALDRMMAKGGKRFSGERGIALQDYGQRLASQEYGAAYGRSLQKYGLETQRAGSAYQRQLGEYGLQYGRAQDIERQQIGQMGRYAGLATTGYQAAGSLAGLGERYAGATAGVRTGAAGAIGQAQVGGAQARAAGTLGVGEAISSGLAAYQYGQGFNQPTSGSGVDWSPSGMGMSQDQMLAEQEFGLF